ncbi:Rieske 2Fe-2S domain-containing protein [Alicyclobacillus fastidiosus]|uniref:Rieske 2Fe-2S domain-containing protein n=1 Tax=Alicyclobacillus fastidiosus TaxID=392011 RepID=A0ABY6ZMM9_9BACL|nr:SRPBCC family protein [Alicyclobacillus fastidiosus]WAH43732.1 Rieske 2Fe-2S domain-containing protein [Alicyclobacillus fastidiosus]GMA59944.1 ring-hydroxylating oxygenase subunit alpha [Alicyclobacillus fastidiosus]
MNVELSRPEVSAFQDENVDMTLPYALYVDPMVLRMEYEKIFTKSWQYVGHVARLKNPGDYIACTIGNEPILVVRDHDNEIRAFYNVCPHRGTKLVQDSAGSKKILQCCYHGWTFQLNGKLHQAPNFRKAPGFCGDDYCLRPVHVSIEQSLVFVNLSEDPVPLAKEFADFFADLGQFHFLNDLNLYSTEQRIIKCNWKTFIDNYLECDHCPIAHPSFVATLDMTKYQIINADKCNIQGSQVKASRQDFNDAEVQEGRFYWLWPNVMFTIYPGPGNFRSIQMIPVDHETTLGIYSVYVHGEEPTEEQKQLIAFAKQVADEDVDIVELQQIGLGSSAFKQGLLSPTEHGLRHFHNLVRTVLK